MYKRRVAEVLLDFCLVAICYYAAYRLRFEDPEDFMKNFAIFSRSLPVVLAAQMVAFFVVGVYRGVWRHFGMMDTVVVAKGVFVGAVARAAGHPLRLPVLQLLADGVRDLRRAAAAGGDAVARVVPAGRRVHPAPAAVRPRVVIYGAGDGGTLVMRELQNGDEAVRFSGSSTTTARKAASASTASPCSATSARWRS